MQLGIKPSKLGFPEQLDSTLCSDIRRRGFVQAAKEIWNQLYYGRNDSFTWGKKTRDIAEYFYFEMSKRFPEFSYCSDGRWKAERFAIPKYSDWSKDTRKSGNSERSKCTMFMSQMNQANGVQLEEINLLNACIQVTSRHCEMSGRT
ncbi:hypothetical protein BC834DRAFT_198332 [Gloeopeniophorella convolvens]|nr:hypothetical protein BC834DRAFT_198332 [Gloeopeniophorella convolvens]